MAAEGDPNIKIQGSVRLVGDSPSSITPQSSTTANRSETSTSIMEVTTTTTTTASGRRVKQTTPREPQQVRSSLIGSFVSWSFLSSLRRICSIRLLTSVALILKINVLSKSYHFLQTVWNIFQKLGVFLFFFIIIILWFTKDKVQFTIPSLTTRGRLFLSLSFGRCSKRDKT